MSIKLSTIYETEPLYTARGILNTGLASGQGALIAAATSSLPSIAAGGVIGLALRIAYKINEILLNVCFKQLQEWTGPSMALSLLRKVVEISAAAAMTYLVLPLIMASAAVSFSTYLMFSALENIRPIVSGGYLASGSPFITGVELRIN
jgi:hypothetical protein